MNHRSLFAEALDEVRAWYGSTFGASGSTLSAAKLMAIMAPVMVIIHELSFTYGHQIIRFLVGLL